MDSKDDGINSYKIGLNNLKQGERNTNNNKTHPFHTTLMVRNIPNRLTQNILLNYIDEDFLGCYDFF